MKRKVSIAVFSFLLLIVSCSKDNEQDVSASGGGTTPPGGCDTVNMQYAANIAPILKANCYSCHGNVVANSGINLESYAGAKAAIDNGKLIGVITHASGYPPMPQGAAKLSDCNINKIRDWINRGAPNN